MKIKFVQHFGGRETREIHYEMGQEVETDDFTLPANIATDLINRGIAEPVFDMSAIPAEPMPEPPKPVRGKTSK